MALVPRLDPSAPIYRQVADGIAEAVARGELAPGAALPSIRELAARLSINANTVQKAYRDLEYSGLVQSRPGSGLVVHPDPARVLALRERAVETILERALAALAAYGVGAEETVSRIRAREGALVHAGDD